VERPVKERLIGAAVLMAAAVILIPEMLSGPSRDSAEKRAQVSEGGEGFKTYTIDLSQTPGNQPPTVTPQPDNRVPPPEQTAREFPAPTEQSPQISADSTSPDKTSPESQAAPPAEAPAQRTPAPAAVAEAPKPRQPAAEAPKQAAAQPQRAPASTPPAARPEAKPETRAEPAKTEPRAVASSTPAPTYAVPSGKGWAVQLGSYSSEATAQRLMKEWRAKGQNAFVMPVTTGGKTLYRVRLGFSPDRAGAEAVLKAVQGSVPKAAVVTHP
jgi:DedD protein